jgi:phosphoglycolate phosphatase
MKNRSQLQAMFFDLDGTILDTAPDLTHALNQVLIKHGRPTLSLETLRPHVAGGSPAMLYSGFQITPTDSLFPTLREEFLAAYQLCYHHQTKFFPGIETLLTYLDQSNIPWGIVTNKPGWLAEPLLKHFKLTHRYRCLVAGDLLPKRKPEPDTLLHACHLTGVEAKHSVYIGDAESDVQAAKAAGMSVIVAKYGYLPANSQPEQWQADMLINAPEEILHWLRQKM